MIPMRLREISAAIGARFDSRNDRIMIKRVTTDSRDVREGDLFVAIRGERFDGHAFIEQAHSDGAVACICDDAWFTEVDAASLPDSLRFLVVPETVSALGRLAGYYRSHVMSVATVVVAVTGSNGKTTTKEMLHQVLGTSFPGRAAPKNFNNHIGVPLTLLSTEAEDRYLIVEVGTNSTGEIEALATIAAPDAAVITSIGEAHVQGLGDLDGIAAEKVSLLRHVRSDGLVVVNIDEPTIHAHLPKNMPQRLITIGADPTARFSVGNAEGDMRRTRFELDHRFQIELPMPGIHHATNAAATFAVARWFGLSPQRIVERLRTFVPPEGRTCVQDLSGVTIVDDAYNANPASMSAAIQTLATSSKGRRVLVLGDMLELGSEDGRYHRRVVQEAMDSGIEVLVPVGPLMTDAALRLGAARKHPCVVACGDADLATAVLLALVKLDDTIWVKGSRGIGLDRVVQRMQQRSQERMAVA